MRTVAATVVVAAALAGCAATGSSKPHPSPTVRELGQRAIYAGAGARVEVVVVDAGAYTPTATSSATGASSHYQRYRITLTNRGASPFEPFFVSSASSAGTEAERLFDVAVGITSDPRTAVLPGASISFDEVYGVSDPADVTYQTRPALTLKPAVWRAA